MSANLKAELAAGVNATTFAEVPESRLAATSDFVRRRLTVSKDSECISFRFTQVGASVSLELFGVEWTERSYSPQAEGE